MIIWSTDSFQQIHELHAHESGTRLALSAPVTSCHVYHLLSGITRLAWNYSDTALVSIAEADTFVGVWDAQAGISMTQLEYHSRPPSAVCFLPDNRLVTGAPDAVG